MNGVTKKDTYPLPRIDDALSILGGNRYFTSLDLQSGFWQVPISEEDREKTAFVTPDGLFQFTVMSFGLCNALATFQRTMDNVVAGLKWKACLVYLDDVLVYSRTFEEHFENLRAVFTRLRESSLKMKPRKCSFAMEQLRYLGHLVSADGLTVDPRKVEAVRELATPSNRSELRSFLGLASYYRKYIAGHADIVAPLTAMLGENQLFKWGKAEQAAFEGVKECLGTAPVLAHPDWDSPFLLQTDASDIALGAVLSQEDENGET